MTKELKTYINFRKALNTIKLSDRGNKIMSVRNNIWLPYTPDIKVMYERFKVFN